MFLQLNRPGPSSHGLSQSESVQANIQMMGSQSSLDDAIANLCSDEIFEQSSKKDLEQKTENEMQEKENIAKNDLQGFLDEDDEDFLALNY